MLEGWHSQACGSASLPAQTVLAIVATQGTTDQGGRELEEKLSFEKLSFKVKGNGYKIKPKTHLPHDYLKPSTGVRRFTTRRQTCTCDKGEKMRKRKVSS
jgi:hypothetical protein